MALSAIKASKLRSVLTLLGIAVGVFSIIAVMTAIGVLRNSIEEGMTQLGANTFQIQKFPTEFEGGHEARHRLRNRKDITYEQANTRSREGDARGGGGAGGVAIWKPGCLEGGEDEPERPDRGRKPGRPRHERLDRRRRSRPESAGP